MMIYKDSPYSQPSTKVGARNWISVRAEPLANAEHFIAMAVQAWRALQGKTLLICLNLFSAIALIFEGYNQGKGSLDTEIGITGGC
jgi:hypothetical protein